MLTDCGFEMYLAGKADLWGDLSAKAKLEEALRYFEALPHLTDVLRKLAAGREDDRLDELLPDRWQSTPAPP